MKVRLLKDLPHCKAWEYEVIKDKEQIELFFN